MDSDQIDTATHELFERAKAADEFEYCCTLLRIRGIRPAAWDPILESIALINQVLSMAQAPIHPYLRARLLLFTYCHATEMDDVYAIPMNLLRVVEGGRCSLTPFRLGDGKEPKYPAGKQEFVVELARQLEFAAIADVFEFMLVRQVRNAFFHSDYTLAENALVICEGDGVPIDGCIRKEVEWSWLMPRLQAGINLALSITNGTIDSARAYTANKTIKTPRVDSFSEATLLADRERGLYGFTA